MKKRNLRLSIILLISMIFILCSVNKEKLKVSPFIKNFILLYINDEQNVNLSSNSHIIKVIVDDNNNGYYITVVGYKKSLLTISDSSYFGCFKFEGYDVYFYGEKHNEFAIGENTDKCKKLDVDKTSSENNIEYDPVEFRISLLKNFKFDKMHSFKGNINADIVDLEYIANTYLKIKNNIDASINVDEVFSNVQQIASFDAGIDSLLSIIYLDATFNKILGANCTSKDAIVRFVVTKEGKVKDPMIIRSSGCEEMDRAIENIVRKFPKMFPAKHRGETVNSYLAIPIKLPVFR